LTDPIVTTKVEDNATKSQLVQNLKRYSRELAAEVIEKDRIIEEMKKSTKVTRSVALITQNQELIMEVQSLRTKLTRLAKEINSNHELIENQNERYKKISIRLKHELERRKWEELSNPIARSIMSTTATASNTNTTGNKHPSRSSTNFQIYHTKSQSLQSAEHGFKDCITIGCADDLEVQYDDAFDEEDTKSEHIERSSLSTVIQSDTNLQPSISIKDNVDIDINVEPAENFIRLPNNGSGAEEGIDIYVPDSDSTAIIITQYHRMISSPPHQPHPKSESNLSSLADVDTNTEVDVDTEVTEELKETLMMQTKVVTDSIVDGPVSDEQEEVDEDDDWNLLVSPVESSETLYLHRDDCD